MDPTDQIGRIVQDMAPHVAAPLTGAPCSAAGRPSAPEVWSRVRAAGGESDTTYAVVYSAVVAIVLGAALYIGMQSFTAGAIWAGNGATAPTHLAAP